MTLLEVKDLTWVPSKADKPVWEGVSFCVEPGELVVLEGPSGSGKSTLLKAIVGFESVTSGQRFWRGKRVDAELIRRFRRQVVYVHQTPVAIAPRIADNLAFPRDIGAELDDQHTMTEAEQRDLLARFGLDNIDWSRRFDELSVGERQRVAFVRCVSVRPQVLMLDEPTASLDPTNAGRIEEFVFEYLAEDPERSVIWISHDERQRRRLDGRTLQMDPWLPDEP